VSSPEDAEAAVAKCIQLFGGLDILVNAAAIHPYGTVTELDLETWNRCLSVNVTGIFLFARLSVPDMKKRGGDVIVKRCVRSGACLSAWCPRLCRFERCNLSLTRALALDYADNAIRVNSISPGFIATPMLELASRTFSPELPIDDVFKRLGDAHPVWRVGNSGRSR
jgi:meso-butanediol dehydrogenase/(S,S)-butanediol dehydrogenase/diacetyl reductase